MRSFFKEISKAAEFFGLHNDEKNLWSSERYFRQTHNEIEKQAASSQLWADLISFYDEHVALKAKVVYEYGPSGIRNGYTESMSQISQNFLDKLKKEGRSTIRAKLELAVAQRVESWMADDQVPTGEKLVVTSPRGNPKEGYPGTNAKNYVFINIFEKTSTGFTLTQLRNYEANQDLPDLQHNLRELGGDFVAANYDHSKHISGRVDLRTINTLLVFPPTVAQIDLEQILYANKADWPIQIDQDLPQLDANQYQEQLNRVISYCMNIYADLLTNNTDFNFEQSSELANQQISNYDLLIKLVREAFLKWVEVHALNYHSGLVGQYDDVDLDQINRVWQAKLDANTGEKLTEDQKKEVHTFNNSVVLNPNLPLKAASSWAHCIAGSPISLLSKAVMLNTTQLNQLNRYQLAEIIGKDRAELWQHGQCRVCGTKTMIGECSVCLSCELKLGDQRFDDTTHLQSEILTNFSGEDTQRAQDMLNFIAPFLLLQSVDLGQFINGDILNPESAVGDYADIAVRIKASPNPLRELEKIVSELIDDNNLHSNSGKQLLFPSTDNETVN